MDRALIVAPIVHTESDMGTLAAALRQGPDAASAQRRLDGRALAVAAMWEGLAREVESLPLPWTRVRLYQDGLPVCGFEDRIAEDLAAQGSPNHRLLLRLCERGAALMGTEDPGLLTEEYRHVKGIIEAPPGRERDRRVATFRQAAPELLAARDRFMADRIRATLAPGETGLLFLGLLHRVDEQLRGDLPVRSLIHRLPFRGSIERELS